MIVGTGARTTEVVTTMSEYLLGKNAFPDFHDHFDSLTARQSPSGAGFAIEIDSIHSLVRGAGAMDPLRLIRDAVTGGTIGGCVSGARAPRRAASSSRPLSRAPRPLAITR